MLTKHIRVQVFAIKYLTSLTSVLTVHPSFTLFLILISISFLKAASCYKKSKISNQELFITVIEEKLPTQKNTFS